MSDYIKQLEEQNEELKQLLAKEQSICSRVTQERDALMPEWYTAYVGRPTSTIGKMQEVGLYSYGIEDIVNYAWIDKLHDGWCVFKDIEYDRSIVNKNGVVFRTLEEAKQYVEDSMKEFIENYVDARIEK